MSFDLRSDHDSEGAQPAHAQGGAMTPGKRSAAGERYGEGGGGGSQPLFAGGAEWEDLQGEDPEALMEAQQPADDEDLDSGPADEEGELDEDSAGEDEGEGELAAAPQAPAGAGAGAGTQAAADGGAGAAQPAAQPARASAASASGAKTYRVNRAYRDGPYGGTAKYDVRVTGKTVTISVGIKLKPTRGVTAAQVKQVKSASQAIFKKKYNRRFKVTEIPYKPRPLLMQLRFSSANAHHDVSLHKGGGRDNAANWYVKGDNTTRAHEIGHLLGLKDEYSDPASPKRKVYTDNSLMGNYYNEGIKTATLKKRHGNVFASDISAASGRRFTISS